MGCDGAHVATGKCFGHTWIGNTNGRPTCSGRLDHFTVKGSGSGCYIWCEAHALYQGYRLSNGEVHASWEVLSSVKLHEGSFVTNKDFHKTRSAQPEPHDSCPMFVGAWGINHVANCAWVKWNHARLAAKSDGALDKQNKTGESIVISAPSAKPFDYVLQTGQRWNQTRLDTLDKDYPGWRAWEVDAQSSRLCRNKDAVGCPPRSDLTQPSTVRACERCKIIYTNCYT